MPITKRFNELHGLADIDVFFDERGLDSEFFNISFALSGKVTEPKLDAKGGKVNPP